MSRNDHSDVKQMMYHGHGHEQGLVNVQKVVDN